MTPRPSNVRASYLLRITGHLDQYWSAWFDGFTITHHADGTTSLLGAVADQAELHGILARIRDLGVTLISVAPVPPAEEPATP